jgi:hypothetical protein
MRGVNAFFMLHLRCDLVAGPRALHHANENG